MSGAQYPASFSLLCRIDELAAYYPGKIYFISITVYVVKDM